MDVVQGFPQLPGPLVDLETGQITSAWRYFFYSLWNRTGQGQGIIDLNASLDALSAAPGAMLFRGLTAWGGLTGAGANKVLKSGAVFPSWGLLGAENFDVEAANSFLAGPVAGAPDVPIFRVLLNNDIPVITDPNKIPVITDPDKIPFKPATVEIGIVAGAAATALTNQWNVVSNVAASTGVICSNAEIGEQIVIFNRGANTLNVFPAVGSQIDGAGVNNAITLAVNGVLTLFPVASTQLYSK